ncbi:hypothetical protein RB601_002135 [Gaeumannomyces tritici]
MAENQALQRLSDVLWAHGAQPDSAALKEAFQQGPEAAAWVQHHLTADTLLSRDELDQYKALESSGQAGRLAVNAGGLDAVQPLDDAELRAAIEELNRSTSAVARQTEALRHQQDALGRLLSQRSAAADARAAMAARRGRAAEAERRALAAAVESLAQRVAGRVADFEEQQPRQQQQQAGGGAEAATGRFQTTLDGLLQSDDRLLASLQKLGQQLEEHEVHVGAEKARETCARLIKHTVEMIRTRLDRVYLEAVESALSSETLAASVDDVKAVEAELEELYTEILPVAQMSAEQQFLEPMVQSLRERDASNLARSSEALNYAEGCLDYLLANMSTLAAHVEDIKAYESASEVIIRTAKAELASPTPPDPTARPSNHNSSPTRRANQSAWPGAGTDVSPVKRPQRSRTFPTSSSSGGGGGQSHRRRSSGFGVPEEPPLDVLLRDLALTLPDDGDLADAAALGSALRSRAAKAADVARDVQASFEASAQHHLADSARAVAMLLEGVLSESPAQPPPATQPGAGDGDDDDEDDVVGTALGDPDIEASLAVLNHEVDRVAAKVRAAEAELRARQAAAGAGKRSASKQEDMVRRWGPVR